MKDEMWISYVGDRFVEVDRVGDGPDALLRATDGSERWWTAAERESEGIWPKCVDCDEESGTCPGGRCRDCDIDYVVASGSCRECCRWIWREEYGGPLPQQHGAACSLANVQECQPRNAEELAAVAAKKGKR